MTDPSEKEMLEWFDGICHFLAIHGWTERDERAVAIRRLILTNNRGPRADEGFIEKWAVRLFQNTPEVQLSSEIWAIRVKEILREAGVRVKEKKKET